MFSCIKRSCIKKSCLKNGHYFRLFRKAIDSDVIFKSYWWDTEVVS